MRPWKTCIALLMSAAALAAGAQSGAPYPSRTIKWIVPYPPGGITDSVTRLVTQRVQDTLGQPIVIENKPGANSIVGVDLAAKSPPDGYTMLTVIAAHAANATLYSGKLPFDSVKSFMPVSLVASAPLILTVNNDFPAKDAREFIAYARANPGKISYATSGIGSASHLTTELLQQTAGIRMVHVPYKGTGPALAALIAGDIHMMVDVPSSMMPQVRGGKIRAIAMFAAKRVAAASEVPTLAEGGGPAIEGSTWVMFMAPAGTPRETVNRLSAEVGKTMAGAELRNRFEQLGIEPLGTTPEQAARFLDDEIAKWAKVITTAGVKAEQ
ncbi:MAG: tripartite tricarboxylate transporter substrate binding protein [Pseudomonadota bacterium]|nr:tripartite tricarboxylate transporter substrate binding protein [Pseudomonadota bacterium]